MPLGRVRPGVLNLAGYRPGKAADQVEAEHGITNAIKLASNENPWPPVPAVADAIREAIGGVNRYGDNTVSAVRSAVSEWLDVDFERISIGCGSSGILQQLFMVYAGPGAEVIFPWPSFEIYPVFSTLFEATQVQVPLRDFAFDLDAVADAVTDRTSIIFLATPNNPTGTALQMADVGELLNKIPDDVIVVIDEAYREFSDPSFGDPVTDLASVHRNLVVTRTFSKAFGLAGLRTGYCVADPEILEQLEKVRLPFSVNNLAQSAMLAAIENEDAALDRVRELISERLRCVNALNSAGVEVVDSHANFIFLPVGDATSDQAIELERAGVVTRPFPGVGLRITIGSPAENDRWLAAYQGLGS